jgi:beta-1,4-mannosyltransferase
VVRVSTPLTVLHSLPRVRPTTNPYLVMLRSRLRERNDLHLLDFSYRTALTRRYRVFHVHWPENLLGGASAAKTVARQLLLTLFLLRLTAQRIPVVRTVDRLTLLRITLNEHTPDRPGVRSVLIPHGHYREWFAPYPHPGAVPGQVGYAGLIRRYKGVESLLTAFADLPRSGSAPVSLRLGGKPSTAQLAETITTLSATDPRITLELRFLSEAEFAEIISTSELVVLPYRFMHNSGGALASLSLDRPVLVPDNEVNRSLAAEVGTGWVHTFEGELSAADLAQTLTAVQQGRAGRAAPDLSRRDWARATAAHAEAYRSAATAATASRNRSTTRGQE